MCGSIRAVAVLVVALVCSGVRQASTRQSSFAAGVGLIGATRKVLLMADVEMKDAEAPESEEQNIPEEVYLRSARLSSLLEPDPGPRTLKFRNYYPRDEELRKYRLPELPDYAKEIKERFDFLASQVDDEVRFLC